MWEAIISIGVLGAIAGIIVKIFGGKKDEKKVVKPTVNVNEPYVPSDSVQHDIDESRESAVEQSVDTAKSQSSDNLEQLKSKVRKRDAKGRFVKDGDPNAVN